MRVEGTKKISGYVCTGHKCKTTLNKIYFFFFTYITNKLYDPLTVKFLKYTNNYRSLNTIMKPTTFG